MKIMDIKAKDYEGDIQKIILEDVDSYYYDYILEELENIAQSRANHNEKDNSNILALILSNNLWTMTLNEFKENENIVMSHTVCSPDSIRLLQSSITHANGKEIQISASGEKGKDFLSVSDESLHKYDYFLKTYIKDIDILFDNVLQGNNIEVHLIGGATKEKFINSKTNKLPVSELLDINQLKIIIKLKKGLG